MLVVVGVLQRVGMIVGVVAIVGVIEIAGARIITKLNFLHESRYFKDSL